LIRKQFIGTAHGSAIAPYTGTWTGAAHPLMPTCRTE
jgi:hypothetical protein